MANFILDKTYKANTVIAPYMAVIPTADDVVAQNTVLGAMIIGVSQENIDATDAALGKKLCQVRTIGISKAVAGAAIANNAKVSAMANGRFQTAATGQHIVGISRSTAAANGDWFDLELVKGTVAP